MASNIIYSTLLGNATQTVEVAGTSTLDYPMVDMLSVLGPVYLPRI
jgi:hypothetical protein